MGICISYRGRLDDPWRLDELTAFVKTFCRRAKWRYRSFSEMRSGVLILSQEVAEGEVIPEPSKEPWPEEPEGHSSFRARVSKINPPPLIEELHRGIVVLPPGTEALRLIFNPQGRLCNFFDVPKQFVINAIPDTHHWVAFPHFTKTSGAPMAHAGICILLRQIKKKFMSNLRVDDPTKFFDTANLDRLRGEHAIMGALFGLMREPGSINLILRAAGLPEVDENAKVLVNEPIEEPVLKKRRPAKAARVN